MRNDWILDVLTDLRIFARANGLPDLAERLDDAEQIAAEELARKARTSPLVLVATAREGDAKGVRKGL